MRCGTTPTHTFTIPPDINMDSISKVKVIYSQNNKTVLCKNTDDCEIDGNTIKIELSQKETLSFNHKLRAEIQVQLLTNDNKSLLSDIIIIGIAKCLDNEVI